MNDQLLLIRAPPRLAHELSLLVDCKEPFDTDEIDSRVKEGGGVAAVVPPDGFLPADVTEVLQHLLPDNKNQRQIEAALAVLGADMQPKSLEELESLASVFEDSPEDLDQIERRIAIDRANRAGGATKATLVAYRCLDGADHYAFRILDREYHATRVRLPTRVEAHRGSEDMRVLYMAGDVADELVVTEVPLSEPRPPPPQNVRDGVAAGGVTPYSAEARDQRVAGTSAAKRMLEAGIRSRDQVVQADKALHEYKGLLAQKATSAIASSKKRGVITSFVHEEWVDAPPWMDHLPPDVPDIIAVEYKEGGDADPIPFRSEMRKYQEMAMKHAIDQAQRKAALDKSTEISMKALSSSSSSSAAPSLAYSMKLIIAGSRGIHDYSLVERAMRESQFPHPSEIVSGGAKGVDELGERFARDHRIKLTRKCADWAKFGKRAGILRNDEMAQYADYLIAIWDGKSAGTKHMIESAKRRGMRTFVLRV